MSTLSILLALVLGGVLLLWGRYFSLRWHGASKSRAPLPKGSSGWPIIGESLAFARDPATYVSSHFKRYGTIFQSSLFLRPVIMGTTPEFARFVISSKLFLSKGAPTSLLTIFGPNAIVFKDGPEHLSVKQLLQKPILAKALRSQVNVLETIVFEGLASWEQRGTINGNEGAKKITFDVGMWFLLGVRDIGSTQEGRKAQESFECLGKAVGSIPVNLPGTTYGKGLKAKAALTEYFKYLIEKRKGQEHSQADVLGALLAAREDHQAREEVKDLDDDMIADNLVVMWFGAFDPTSTMLTWVLKLLVDNPDVFRRIQAEQQEILQSNDPSAQGPRLSWEDTRKMVYSQKVFKELQRFLAIVPAVGRQATQDIEYAGYLIPKGWAVWLPYTFIHSDPAIYPDPKRFDPDRFDAIPPPSHTCHSRRGLICARGLNLQS